MKSLCVLMMMICCLQSQWFAAKNFKDIESVTDGVHAEYSPTDCSQYDSDEKVYATFPFFVHFNSSSNRSTKTYGRKSDRGHVDYLNVANEEYLPSSVFCLIALKQLHIRNTKFQDSPQQLPAAIDHLASSLTHLSIRNTLITYLPEEIGKLKRLVSLELCNISLRSLPDSIGRLSSLVYLDLRDNQLTALPSTLAKTSSLKTLLLDNNKQLRTVQSLRGHPSLRTLQTDNCPIEQIPINLSQLAHLYMANNRLTDLYGIDTLGVEANEMKIFYFYNNSIRYVTPHIQRVSNLANLNLDHNKLHSLPPSIFITPGLEYLTISNNCFRSADLEDIVAKFNITHPKLKLSYLPQKCPEVDVFPCFNTCIRIY